jgi:hypothetical protein
LSLIVIAPVLVPLAVGVKVTDIVHCAPDARLDPQLLLWAKSPEAAMPEIARMALPVFVIVIVFGGLVVPTFCVAKVRLVGDRLTAGTGRGVAVPVGVAVGVGVSVAVKLAVAVAVAVGVAVPVGVAVAVAVPLAVAVAVAVGVAVLVVVAVAVAVGVGVRVPVGVAVAVGVALRVALEVEVGVGLFRKNSLMSGAVAAACGKLLNPSASITVFRVLGC